MDTSTIPLNLKRNHKKSDYLKVFISPLKWCPAFGYLPSIADIKEAFKINDSIEETVQQCLGIIESARFNLGVYDTNMVEYARLPDPKELIFIYHEYPYTAVRKLFKHLDYLALKTAERFSPSFYDNIFIQLRYTIKNIPPKPIGRRTNRWEDELCSIVRNIRINSYRPKFLLQEVKKIIGDNLEIDYAQLLSLYAILEAWLILTSLLFKIDQKERHEKDRLKNIHDEFNFKMERDLIKSASLLISELKYLIDLNAEFWTNSTGGDTKKVSALIDAMSDDLYKHFNQYATDKTFKFKILPVGFGTTPFQQELKRHQTKNISGEFDYRLRTELATRASIFLPGLRDWVNIKSKRWIKIVGGNIEKNDALITSMNNDIELIIQQYTERYKDFKFTEIPETPQIDVMNELPYIKDNLTYAHDLLQLADYQKLSSEKLSLEESMSIKSEKQSEGGSHKKTDGIRAAQNEAIKKIKSTVGKEIIAYFEKNRAGKRNAMKVEANNKQYKVYYDPEKQKFVQFDVKNKTYQFNAEKSFLTNLTKVKKTLKIPE